MVNQKLISFKISLKNLEDIDNYVYESSRWTTRNAELNKAVAMYIELKKAIEYHNYEGDASKIKVFIERYIHRYDDNLFK